VAALVAAVAVGVDALTGSGTDPATGERSRPLPTATAPGGVPTTFVGIYQRGSGDLGKRGKLSLALLSTADGHPVRDLAVTTVNSNLQLGDPSRGPDGDVWFVRRSRTCGGGIVRVDAATGRSSVVVSRPGRNLAVPVVSPDGRSLAYIVRSCDLRNGANELVLRDLSTGRERGVLPVDARGHPGAVPTAIKLQMCRRSGQRRRGTPTHPASSSRTW